MSYYNLFTFKVEIEDYSWTKKINTTNANAAVESMDFLNEKLLNYFEDMNIADPEEQERIIDHSTVSYEYEREPLSMYAVYDALTTENPIIGIYYSLADAEEAIFIECENYVEEVFLLDDMKDIFGREINLLEDYWFLMNNCAECFEIQTVPVYDVEEREN